MIKVDDTLFHQHPEIFQDVEKNAIYQLQELHRNHRVQDDIFRIIKNIKDLHLIKFPVEDENFAAFTVNNSKKFIFINSFLPLEKQIFAAAHELYHVLYDYDNDEEKNELLTDIESSFNGNIDEMKANSFAACLMVPKLQLKEEISLLNIDQDNIELIDIIKLMDAFAVPYKTIILRLYEVGIIKLRQAKDFMCIPDRDSNKGVLLLINKTGHAKRWQVRNYEEEYTDFINVAIKSLEQNIVTKNKVESDFNKIGIKASIESYLERE